MKSSSAERSAGVKQVAEASLAGQWYSARPNELRTELNNYLAAATHQSWPDVCALIQPHAGYVYSGATAACGLKAAQGRAYKRIVVLGGSHQSKLSNQVAALPATHFATPLGEIPLDTESRDKLLRYPEFVSAPAAFRGENSVELQLPLLQAAFSDFVLLPLVIGQLDAEHTVAVAQSLRTVVDADTLVVASTDFTHYGERFGYVPFTKQIPENLKKLDLGAFEFIRKKDFKGFYAYLHKTGATICGLYPVAVLLAMLPTDVQVELLCYDTSGAQTGSYENSVSYLSAAVRGKWTASERPVPVSAKTAAPSGTALSAADKQQLLKLARATIDYALKNKRRPKVENLPVPLTAGMQGIYGGFVTLTAHGDLRGCIGEIEPRRALYKVVLDHAIDAAFNDPRFPQLTPEEWPQVKIEISALYPPHKVQSWQDIEIGKHGMVLHKNGRSAVFLPQVAPEQGWGLEETLTHLAQKAGLPADAWKSGAEFEVFTADVFRE